jgi:hypothetical protein
MMNNLIGRTFKNLVLSRLGSARGISATSACHMKEGEKNFIYNSLDLKESIF